LDIYDIAAVAAFDISPLFKVIEMILTVAYESLILLF